MKGIARIRRLLRGDRAVIGLMVAIGLPVLVGLTGAAVDMGVVYSAKNELQNAADSAALAAAAVMIYSDASGNMTGQPDLALTTAHQYAAEHHAVDVNLAMLTDDFTIGKWSLEIAGFETTGFSTNPEDLSAVRVVMRRDQQANTPVGTFFLRILGFNQIPVTASAVAYLGYAGDYPDGYFDFPISLDKDKVNSGRGVPTDIPMLFNPEGDEWAEWTTFSIWPSNDVAIRRLLDGLPLDIGYLDEINVINGNLSSVTWKKLRDKFLAMTAGGAEWIVTVPVVEPGNDAAHKKVVGWAKMKVTDVQTSPGKFISGVILHDNVYQLPNSRSGGGNYGVRAAIPVLVN